MEQLSRVQNVEIKKTDESDEHRIKKYEQLFDLTKHSLEYEKSRREKIERKAYYYMAVLVLIAGFYANALAKVVEILDNILTYSTSSIWDYIFSSSYILLGFSIFVSLIYFLRALAFQEILVHPYSNELIEFFDTNRYIDILHSMSRRQIEAVNDNIEITDQKLKEARIARRWIVLTVVLAAICTTFYFFLFNIVKSIPI